MPYEVISGTSGYTVAADETWNVIAAGTTLSNTGVAWDSASFDYGTLRVEGLLRGIGAGGWGAYLQNTGYATIFVAASGAIRAEANAVNDLAGSLNTILNNGVIRSTTAAGIISTGSYLTIVNTNNIIGLTEGIDLESAFGTIDNSGLIQAMSAGGTGLAVGTAATLAVIDNTGTIRGNVGVELLGTYSALNNHGTVIGDGGDALVGGLAPVRIHNWGTFEGNVRLSAGADRFYMAGNGHVLGIIAGDAGNDVLRGGAWVDRIYGGADNDRIGGFGGNDLLYGGTGDDTVLGGAGNDRIEGNAGADTLYGGGGNDVILGGDGLDMIYGEDGNDVINLGIGGGIGYGGAGDDTIRGVDGAPFGQLRGWTGNDRLIGGTGTEAFLGGPGDDVLTSGGGTDAMYGGTGNDQISGALGPQILFGNAGNDFMRGWGGNDTLLGGAGNDRIYGDAGNDAMTGNIGDDRMWGGTGADQFYFQEFTAAAGSNGHNMIMDFDDGADRINLSVYHALINSTFGSLAGFVNAARTNVNGDAVIDLSLLPGVDGDIVVLNQANHIWANDFIY